MKVEWIHLGATLSLAIAVAACTGVTERRSIDRGALAAATGSATGALACPSFNTSLLFLQSLNGYELYYAGSSTPATDPRNQIDTYVVRSVNLQCDYVFQNLERLDGSGEAFSPLELRNAGRSWLSDVYGEFLSRQRSAQVRTCQAELSESNAETSTDCEGQAVEWLDRQGVTVVSISPLPNAIIINHLIWQDTILQNGEEIR